jgi:hypothetical protein
METVDAQQLFPGALKEIYDALSARVLGLGDDIVEEFSRTQVGYGAARKFVWLTPVTKTKALLTMDMWDEHHGSFLAALSDFVTTSTHTRSKCARQPTSRRWPRSAGSRNQLLGAGSNGDRTTGSGLPLLAMTSPSRKGNFELKPARIVRPH